MANNPVSESYLEFMAGNTMAGNTAQGRKLATVPPRLLHKSTGILS